MEEKGKKGRLKAREGMDDNCGEEKSDEIRDENKKDEKKRTRK